MLNMSVAPQLVSPAENSGMARNPGLSGAAEPVKEEFRDILEREVSETAEPRQAPVNNPDNSTQAEEGAKKAAASEETGEASKDIASAKDAHSLIQSLLGDATLGNRQNQPANLLSTLPEPESMMPLSSSPNAALATLLKAANQGNPPMIDATLATANQTLQQTLAQQTQAAGNLNMQANNFWQFLGTADSAVNGNLLPLASELSETIQGNANEPVLLAADESSLLQSVNLNSTAASAASVTASAHEVHVDQPVGQAKWGGEFAQKVVWLSSQQQQVAEIHLNPEHLGPVEVMLTITQDQATAQFVSPHSTVREAIEQALPKLREMMAENGIQLGNVMVGTDSFQQENRQQQAHHSDRRSPDLTGSKSENINQVEMTAVPIRRQGIVNTYA